MIRRLRTDLAWREHPSGGEANSRLYDPVTGREFALSAIQVALLEALVASPDLETAASRASEATGEDISAELLDELLDVFDELALLDGFDPATIPERQREARREFFRLLQTEALAAMVERLLELPHYADVLPRPLPELEQPEDVALLPILDKPTLRARFDALLPANMPDDVDWLSTSGTSGERQQVARSRSDWRASQQATWALNRIVSAGLDERFCRLTTPFCNGMECHVAHASMAERTQGRRLALVSSLDIASWPDERIAQTVREMKAHEPAYLLVDPTYLAIVVDRARALRLALPRVRFVLSSFESCSALHRRVIEAAFECRVFDVYGATEHGAIILQCERGRHHVNPESVIVEVDSADSNAVGRMLVTTLGKTVMPLLRYDTGDLAIASDTPCDCAWSETDMLESLEGRSVDCIEDTQGRRITPGAIDRAVAPELSGVVTYCLVQYGPAAYRLELLPGEGFVAGHGERAKQALHALLGPGAAIRVVQERELLPAASGKFRLARRSER
jgi:phenylacetate-CoA ligase